MAGIFEPSLSVRTTPFIGSSLRAKSQCRAEKLILRATKGPPPSTRLGNNETVTEATLLALDVDGTLLDPTLLDPVGVSPEVAQAVRDAADSGIHVALATGRQAHATVAFAQALGLQHGWLSSTFGAVTLRLDPTLASGFEIVRSATFDPRPLIERLAYRPDVMIAVDDPGVGFLVDRHWPAGELVEPLTLIGEREITSTTSLMARSTTLSRDELVAAAQADGLSCEPFALRGASWINVTPLGHTKKTGIEGIAEMLGVSQANVIAVGAPVSSFSSGMPNNNTARIPF